jgi:leucyl aminopeptidase
MAKLKKMGAGAFVAVGQGSEPQDAAIVHLTYKPKQIKKNIAVIGKGICFDTGGHNLKQASYMNCMHEDICKKCMHANDAVLEYSRATSVLFQSL